MKHAILIAVACAVMAMPASAQTAAQLNAAELARIQSGGAAPPAPPPMAAAQMAPATQCAPGYQWLPAGYAKKGKYRPAGCFRRR